MLVSIYQDMDPIRLNFYFSVTSCLHFGSCIALRLRAIGVACIECTDLRMCVFYIEDF